RAVGPLFSVICYLLSRTDSETETHAAPTIVDASASAPKGSAALDPQSGSRNLPAPQPSSDGSSPPEYPSIPGQSKSAPRCRSHAAPYAAAPARDPVARANENESAAIAPASLHFQS